MDRVLELEKGLGKIKWKGYTTFGLPYNMDRQIKGTNCQTRTNKRKNILILPLSGKEVEYLLCSG